MNKFFIVGCPRSGTTMLQQALNRHSQIVVPPETSFFFALLGRCWKRQCLQLLRINADLAIHVPLPARRVRQADDGRELYERIARSYLDRLGRPDVSFFGEKSPEHLRRLPQIHGLFPDAKIILIYRDGRDVALSLTKVSWMHPDLYVNFAVWLYYHRLQIRATASRPSFLHVVKYEDLVTRPEVELRQIVNFLGLPYESAMATSSGNREGIPQWEYEWKSRALEPISTARVGCWQKELSTEQIRILERWGQGALQSLGYPLLTDARQPLPWTFFPKLWWRILRWRFQRDLVGPVWESFTRAPQLQPSCSQG